MAKKFLISGMIIAILTGILVGWYSHSVVTPYFDFTYSWYLFMGFFIALFVIMEFKTPVVVELFSFSLTTYILFQASWDLAVQDWNMQRAYISMFSLLVFVVNLFSGHVRIKTAKKIARRQFGI